MANTPISFNDPAYDAYDAANTKEVGLPAGLLSSIRTKGERSNADQVSNAGARTVYQITPATRNAVLNKYGVDAYADPNSASKAAALLLKESLVRNDGNAVTAVREYHGGTNPANWGPANRAYVTRVTGQYADAPVGLSPDDAPVTVYDPSMATLLGLSGEDRGTLGAYDARRPAIAPKAPKSSSEAVRQQAAANEGLVLKAPATDVSAVGPQAGLSVSAADQQAQSRRDSVSTLNVLGSHFNNHENFTARLYDWLDSAEYKPDPEWKNYFLNNLDHLTAGARNSTEYDALTQSSSQADYDARKAEIERQRGIAFVQSSGGTVTNLAGGLIAGTADPVALLATAGTGTVLRGVGLGTVDALRAGRYMKAMTALSAEGAVSNTILTAGADIAGDNTTVKDYARNAALGGVLGALTLPLHLYGLRDNTLADTANSALVHAVSGLEDLHTQAVASAGADAAPAAVYSEMMRISRDNIVKDAEAALSPPAQTLGPSPESQSMAMEHEIDVPTLEAPRGAQKLSGDGSAETIVPGDWFTRDPAVRDDVIARFGLDAHPDDATRSVMAEYAARAEQFMADKPVNQKALKTILQKVGLESISNTLLSSDNVAAKAFAAAMLENGQGAAGRRATAAISAVLHDRMYLREIAQWDHYHRLFRESEGIGAIHDFATGEGRSRFNERVYAEVEARKNGATLEDNAAVKMAADALERGYSLMAKSQKAAQTLGHARIADSSVGYQPHRVSAKEAVKLLQPDNRDRARAVRKVLSRQFQERLEFDKEFSDKLAKKYLYEAANRARKGWDIPMNVHDPESADIVIDAAKAMGLTAPEAESVLGKFSRGGAGHTKGRLDLDLSETIPDGKGGEVPLSSLFNRDPLQLYRGYARRVAGEVALAQRGVLGKKGLQTYRELIEASGGSDKALEAYDQASAELLNTPFGQSNNKYLDNARILSSIMDLGGMGITQFGEYGNAMATLGVHRTLAAIGGIKRLGSEVGDLVAGKSSTHPILHDLDQWSGGLGVTDYHFSRLFDVPDNAIQLYGHENVGMLTRVLRAGGNVQAIVSGHRFLLGAQVRGMAEQIVPMAIQYTKAGMESPALRDMGISAAIEGRLRANLPHIAEFDGKGKLTRLELTKGDLTTAELEEFTQAVVRGSSQIIQHAFTGETGKWAHNGFLKLLTQFRTFGLISVEKQWGRNVANYGAMKSFAYLMGAMSFALPIQYVRVHAHAIGMSDSDKRDYLNQNLSAAAMAHATLNYVSQAGVAGDVWDVGGSVMGGWAGPDFGDAIGVRGAGRQDISHLVPAVGALNDLYGVAQGNQHKISRVMPFGNLPYVQPAFNYVGAQ